MTDRIASSYLAYGKGWDEHYADAKNEAANAKQNNRFISSFRFKNGKAYGHKFGDSKYLNIFSSRAKKKRHYVKATYTAIKNTYGPKIADQVMAGHRSKFYTKTHSAKNYEGTTHGLSGELAERELDKIDAKLRQLQVAGLAPKITNVNFDGNVHTHELNAQQLADVTSKVHHPDMPESYAFGDAIDNASNIENGVHKSFAADLARCKFTFNGTTLDARAFAPGSDWLETDGELIEKRRLFINENARDVVLGKVDRDGRPIEGAEPPMTEDELRVVSTYVHQGIFPSINQAASDPANAASHHPFPYEINPAGDQKLAFTVDATDTPGVFTFTARITGNMGQIIADGADGAPAQYEFVDPRVSTMEKEISGTIDTNKEGTDGACQINHAKISYKATYMSKEDYMEAMTKGYF